MSTLAIRRITSWRPKMLVPSGATQQALLGAPLTTRDVLRGIGRTCLAKVQVVLRRAGLIGLLSVARRSLGWLTRLLPAIKLRGLKSFAVWTVLGGVLPSVSTLVNAVKDRMTMTVTWAKTKLAGLFKKPAPVAAPATATPVAVSEPADRPSPATFAEQQVIAHSRTQRQDYPARKHAGSNSR